MCIDCGCSQVNSVSLQVGADVPPHQHEHNHPRQTLQIHEHLISKNDRFAQQNRANFQTHGLLTLNILSSPGSGKTTLIEQMAKAISGEEFTVKTPLNPPTPFGQAAPKVRGEARNSCSLPLPRGGLGWGEDAELGEKDFWKSSKAWQNRANRLGVIVGDLATENDAFRLRAAGANAIQITTGTACHLEADMVAHALEHLDLANLDLLVIENVGNLVCPAAYDLGETLRVVLLSVTEGEDKPLKYPTAFQSADVVLLTKMDIAAAVAFERATAITNIRRMAPQAQLFELSARTGLGLDPWLAYLRAQQKKLLLEVAR